MIGGLQGEFGDLDIKYLKQNISKCRSQISGSFRRTLQLCVQEGCEISQQKGQHFAAKGWFRSRVKFAFNLEWSTSMDSKELSSILDCFGDQITNKNTKTYTIWLEMLAKVLNMLIGLKGDNYYSKVFKKVNYKLSNSTFWVVIILLEWKIPFYEFVSNPLNIMINLKC